MYVVGTAGHIDHGKSTLIRSLTGIDPDRLQEERARGMTIDLGFAWMKLPSEREIGIVDVPGHHRFIRNMLAGVGSINLTLFVVAATEGWMPQSQEHLEILDLLQVHQGIIVLTKSDLVDEEWLMLVEEDVREAVQGTGLADAPIVRVASTTGEGIDELVARIDTMLDESAQAKDIARPRLWIDRVFSIHGTGSVVTGTLIDGSLRVDQSVTLFPSGIVGRVRGLQVHGRDVESAVPGSRVAVNLSGVGREQMHRGDVLGSSHHHPTDRVNAALRLLPGVGRHLKGIGDYHIYLGSAERIGRARLLGADRLEAGGEGLLQISFDRPVVALIGDRFVLRDATTQRTLGGGHIVDANPRHVRRKSLRYVKDRQTSQVSVNLWPERMVPTVQLARTDMNMKDLIMSLVDERRVFNRDELFRQIPAHPKEFERHVQALEADGSLIALPTTILSAEAWNRLTERLLQVLHAYHAQFPLRQGVSKESLCSQTGVDHRLFDEAIDRWTSDKTIVMSGATVRANEHVPRLTVEQHEMCRKLIQTVVRSEAEAPTPDELHKLGYDEELINWLISEGQLIRIGEFLYARDTIDAIQTKIGRYIEMHGSINVAALRDMLDTSRRYALPLLEYFDEKNYTRRIGDTRVLA